MYEERIKEACGVFGIYRPVRLKLLCLYKTLVSVNAILNSLWKETIIMSIKFIKKEALAK